MGDVTKGLDIEPEKGTADNGDLEVDLPSLFIAIAEAAEDRKTPVAIFLDEIQYFNKMELGALIMAMHKIQQHQLPLVLLGAGLPILPGLAGESKSYAERLFSFPNIGALSQQDSEKAVQEPAQEAGIAFEPSALTEVYRLTKGYPYFLQEWGDVAWNVATSSPISLQIIQDATMTDISRLDEIFFGCDTNASLQVKKFPKGHGRTWTGCPSYGRYRRNTGSQGHESWTGSSETYP